MKIVYNIYYFKDNNYYSNQFGSYATTYVDKYSDFKNM